MPFLSPNQQHKSSEGKNNNNNNEIKSQEPTLHSINCTKHTPKFGLCRQLGGIQSCRRMTTLCDWTTPCCVNTGQNLTSTILFTDRTTAPLSDYSQCQICVISQQLQIAASLRDNCALSKRLKRHLVTDDSNNLN